LQIRIRAVSVEGFMVQRSKYLLLASGDETTLHALSQALVLTGYPVLTALSWTEVLARLHRFPLSVILYDIVSLDDEERERLSALRRIYPQLSVILLSSLESPELSRAVEEGLVAALVVKPVQLSTLEECLDRLGAGRQVMGA
jgi:DNA-binding NtrC family response regulator